MAHPAHDRRMAYRYLTFGHHGREVPIAEAVCQVPADTLLDEMRTVATATIDGVAGSGLGHFGVSQEAPIIGYAVNAPEPGLPAEECMLKRTVLRDA